MTMSTWTPERIAEVTRLWDEGLTTAEIGKLVGVTKNAVVGKAHRLGLPPRPSPIRRQGGAAASGKAPLLIAADGGAMGDAGARPKRAVKLATHVDVDVNP
ncbi:MAG: GcrA family cell cycle regulator, partial [Alphaproteobacteria bacterium]|nr:GcrA family cell cycle regulator [Alphaproteobacteria bacterium]